MPTRFVQGLEVEYRGARFRVHRTLGPDAVLLRAVDGTIVSANPLALSPVAPPDMAGQPPGLIDPDRVPPAERAKAERRRDAIARLLCQPADRSAAVAAVAGELGLGSRRVWDLLAAAEAAGGADLALFLPRRHAHRARRLSREVEAIIDRRVAEHYATLTRPSVSSLHTDVAGQCHAAALPVPSYKAIKARVRARDQAWLTRRRHGPRAARAHRLLTGAHPGAVAPWERVQIDSTRCDIRLVREVDRQPIGRPTLTVALDLYSRTICGFSVLLEGAGTVTVATCLAQACLPKEEWLGRRGLGELRWPIFGKPSQLDYDQGPENTARGIQRGLRLHGIAAKVRPKGLPEHHGHIERLIGTLMRRVHELPGTTFSNHNERGETEPERLACLSLSELEAILAVEAVRYNETVHSATGERPIERYLAYFRQPGLADADRVPPLLPAERLLLDFLPYERRRLRRTGLRLFGVDYSARDLLLVWQAQDRERAPPKRIVVYDPRGLATVHVADETTGAYIPAHTRVPRADFTLAESEEARRALARLRSADRSEARLFDHLERTRAIVDRGRTTTARAKAERSAQARRSVGRSATPSMEALAPREAGAPPDTVVGRGAPAAIAPFDDVEEVG